MVLEFSLDENDFLQHQLFVASKSDRIKSKRRKSWMIVSLAVLIVGILFYEQDNKFMVYCFLALLIYTICFYPLYLRSLYKKHFAEFVADAYKNRVGIMTSVSIGDNLIECFDKTGESKINTTELTEISETGEHIYLRLKIGESLIIPKLKIENLVAFRTELLHLSGKLGINYTSELNWKWK